jgi:hypothetical protein
VCAAFRPLQDLAIEMVGGRKLVVSALQAFQGAVGGPFVALVPAFSAEERKLVEAIARLLLDSGCEELCCVGPEAEMLHDTLDALLERSGRLEVVTTGIEDLDEALEYFLYGAGGGSKTLLALVSDHPDLAAALLARAR